MTFILEKTNTPRRETLSEQMHDKLFIPVQKDFFAKTTVKLAKANVLF